MPDKEETRTYMEEADEEGNVIDDTKTYVSHNVKEEANVSRTRKEKGRTRRRDSSSPATNLYTDSDSTAHPASPLRRESKSQKAKEKVRDKDREKRKSISQPTRPAMKGSKTLPSIQTMPSSTRRQQEQPSFYGVSPSTPAPIMTAAATQSRPRSYTNNPNQRPASFYGPSVSKPPSSNLRYRQLHTPVLGTSFPPQAPLHPPPSPSLYHVPYPPPPQPIPIAQPPPQPDYFNQVSRDPRDVLMSRFEYNRPRSAMARPSPPAIAYGPDYDDDHDDDGALVRRPSLTKRSSRREEDRIRMPPPPPRPSTSRPMSTHSPFAPPPSNRRSIASATSLTYDDESVDDESSYQETSPSERWEYRAIPVRRPSIDSTAVYDMGPRYLEMAGHQSRRNSYYGARNQSTERDMEDRIRMATQYQEAVDGGPTESLTVDSLRKIGKTPSRGTKSTESREESGYGMRSAATTRTSVEEDMTILVKGTATLTIGNTQMNVKDGTEIRIPTNPGGDRDSRGESENASSAYEERGPRFDRPHARGRASSRTASRSRGQQSYYNQQALPPLTPLPQPDYGTSPYHYQQMLFAPPSGFSYPAPF